MENLISKYLNSLDDMRDAQIAHENAIIKNKSDMTILANEMHGAGIDAVDIGDGTALKLNRVHIAPIGERKDSEAKDGFNDWRNELILWPSDKLHCKNIYRAKKAA